MTILDPRFPGERVRELGAGVYMDDGARIMAALAGELPADSLQLAGDGLCCALRQGIEGAADLAVACVDALRGRWVEGDEDLADQIEAILGTAPSPALRPLALDLDDLSMVLEGDPMLTGGRIDLRTGEVIHSSPMFESDLDLDEEDDLDDPERWLHVGSLGSRPGYDDMTDFLATVADDDAVLRLERTLHGRGVFRRFKDALSEIPGELERFHRFSDDRQRGRARAWLAGEGYRPVPPRHG